MSETALQVQESPLREMFLVPEFDAETGLALTYNERVDKLYMFLIAQPQCDVGTEHIITPGLYTRKAKVPTGAFLISKTHKQEHQFIMSSGIIEMVDESGEIKRLEGYNAGVTKPGTRRVVYVVEEVTFTTCHPTSKTTLPEIEAELYLEDEIGISTNPNTIDFLKAVSDLNLTTEMVRILTNRKNVVPFPEGEVVHTEIRSSPIEGVGTFATADFKAGQRICTVTVGQNRTPAGRYLNHSPNNNVIFIADEKGVLSLYASRDIASGEELLTDYRQTYRESLQSAPLRKQLT